MSRTKQEKPKALVLEAFDTFFNKRNYVTVERYWSPHYIQNSAHIEPGREGPFNLIESLPDTLRYEACLAVAEGDFVIAYGRFSGFGAMVNWIAADILRIQDGILVEHWDVIQDEATEQESKRTRSRRPVEVIVSTAKLIHYRPALQYILNWILGTGSIPDIRETESDSFPALVRDGGSSWL